MPTILVVEDDENLRYGLEFNLKRAGFEVTACSTGEAGMEAWQTQPTDMVLLDLMLPGISGLEVLEKIRANDLRVPITMLTARSDESDAVTALSLGADDYIRKPFGVSELIARLEARLRRVQATAVPRSEGLGPWTFDLENLRATHADGRSLSLTTLEVDLLSEFLSHRGEVLRREDLLSKVWGVGTRTLTRTLDNHVARLRKKLEEDPKAPKLLLTVHGVGYKAYVP